MITELNKESITELLKDFNILTGIRICLFDIKFNEILAYPKEQPNYCLNIRSDAEGRKKCRECDIAALTVAKKTKGFHIYSCHAGFTEAVCPIKYEGESLGYLMLGHVHEDTSPAQVKAAAKIMESCAGYIYLSRLVKLKENAIEKRLGEYLIENLSRDLSIDTLCKQFDLSRVSIYSLFKRIYDSSPAEYIKQLRLNHACKLLKTTNKKIAFIASQSGFEDYNYFAKQFKKEYKISPGKYRES